MAFETITLATRDGVGVVTLNRPERLNAINKRMLEELGAAMDALEADAAVRAIVLTGTGSAFSSGFDLKEQMAQLKKLLAPGPAAPQVPDTAQPPPEPEKPPLPRPRDDVKPPVIL